MKKLTLGLAVLLSSYAANALASLPTGTSRCDVCVPNYCGGFTFGATGLYWRASSPEWDWATTFDQANFAEFTGRGNGHSHNDDDEYEWGFKANVGYIFPCSGNDVNLTYTHWDDDHDDHVAGEFAVPPQRAIEVLEAIGPTFPFITVTVPGVLHPAVLPLEFIFQQPGFVIESETTEVAVKSEFENRTWDLDFGQAINVGCNFKLRWFGGVRYSRIEHELHTVFNTHVIGDTPDRNNPIRFTGADLVPVIPTDDFGGNAAVLIAVDATVTDIFHTESKFDGVGPRLGFDASYGFCGGFGIVGSLSTSLLVGETDGTFSDRIQARGTADIEILTNAITVNGGDTVIEAPNNQFVSTFENDTGVLNFDHPDETRVVPNIDAKLGLDYTYQFCNCSRSKLTIEAGYLVSYYWNPIDRLTARDFTDPELNTRRALDVAFDGPYVSVQVAL